MSVSKEQIEWMLQELTAYKRGYENLLMENDVLKNAITGIARTLKIPPEEFAKGMLGGKYNEEYEKDVIIEFQKLTGRTTDSLDMVVSQELRKEKKK